VSDGQVIVRTLVAFAVAFTIGFEREVRGAHAGDRTFAVIGTASAAIASVTGAFSPQALAGIVTGVGFIGGGLILRAPDEQRLHGVTTAATVFGVAGTGLVVGLGHLAVGAFVGLLILLALEVRYLPLVRVLDARRYRDRFAQDDPDR
jgi:putative Mg2+ transporter-C (MgtC) family protein